MSSGYSADPHESTARTRVRAYEDRFEAGWVAANGLSIEVGSAKVARAAASLRYAPSCRNLQCARPRFEDEVFSRDGLCSACRAWRRKHGEDRPLRVILRRQRPDPSHWRNQRDYSLAERASVPRLTCVNCYSYVGPDTKLDSAGRCPRCRRRYYKTGRDEFHYEEWRADDLEADAWDIADFAGRPVDPHDLGYDEDLFDELYGSAADETVFFEAADSANSEYDEDWDDW